MKYLDTRNKSLEDSVIRVLRGLSEKIEYVEYKFRSKNDAVQVKKMIDGMKMDRPDEVNDDGIMHGLLTIDAGNKDMTKLHTAIMNKYRPKVVTQEKLDTVDKKAVKKDFDDRKDKDIDNDGDVDDSDEFLHKKRKAITKAVKTQEKNDVKEIAPVIGAIARGVGGAVARGAGAVVKKVAKKAGSAAAGAAGAAAAKKESYDIGNDWAKHTLDVTPGQEKNDVDEMLGIAQKKNTSMREALAKVWGIDEGKNPFEKTENKIKEKTLTGKKPTEVKVDPEAETK